MLSILRSILRAQCMQRIVHRSGLLQHSAWCSIMMNIYVQAGLTVGI